MPGCARVNDDSGCFRYSPLRSAFFATETAETAGFANTERAAIGLNESAQRGDARELRGAQGGVGERRFGNPVGGGGGARRYGKSMDRRTPSRKAGKKHVPAGTGRGGITRGRPALTMPPTSPQPPWERQESEYC